ncbi:efflux RND transporter permease subunit [Egicoccus halophilus]|uniref:SSD domain-containing protein n=1 Tax=Egicoccus halophilus TaxID=1670830 RepID=A0A8J3A7S2_9ACTN|nr:MMPL family transporter [Egicoccus halophilus]GGI03673.1 hypothetical protein GCM10011354_05210 [Egicoccus halophilus]
MQRLVDAMSRLVERRPGWTLLALALVTAVLGVFGVRLEVETDIAEFAGDAELAQAFEAVDERFGVRGGGLQVVVDAGIGGNVLDGEGLRVGERLEELTERTLGDVLAEETPQQPAVVSYALPVLEGAEQLDLPVEELTDTFVAALLQQSLAEDGDELRGLLSGDLDVERARARGGLVVVDLDPELDEEQRLEAGLALQEALDAEDTGFLDAEPFSFELFSHELEESMLTELPVLLGLSVLLIMAVLWVLFRRLGDVLLSLTGLLLVQVWLAGSAVLLGPQFLGLTGQFSQIAVAVPVMLVGLGVDYSVHLVARYREEQAAGRDAPTAAGGAVRTVGVALLLVTVTTMVGFLSNVTSPLPPIADFGIFTAAGMLGAFLVMGLLIPSARQLLDRRRSADGPIGGAVGGGEGRLEQAMASVAELAVRFPVPVIVAGLVAGVLGTLAAIDLDTEFSQEEFVPDDARVGGLLDRMDELFGGDVTEETFLLVEGDFTDPAVVQALHDTEASLPDIDDVRTVEGGGVDVVSPRTLVNELREGAEVTRERLVEQARVAVGEQPVEDLLPLPDAIGREELPDEGGFGTDGIDDGEYDLGGDGVDAPTGDTRAGGGIDEDELQRRLPPGVDESDALLGLLDDEEVAQALEQGAEEELREDLLGTLGEDTATALAATEPGEVDLALLEAIGYPLEELEESSRELLALAVDLEAAGWSGEAPDDDADLDTVYDRVTDLAHDALDQVLDEGRTLALVMVPTEAGEEDAEPLADALEQAAAPLAEVADDVLVVSEQLVVQETLDLLIEAQTEKILYSLGTALLLLVVYETVRSRRPMLGVITMVPTVFAVPIVLGVMWLIGLPFNALTATIASVAIGFGVDYGIHLSNRFQEESARAGSSEQAVRETVRHTGAALAGSAITTTLAFGVLMLSDLEPIVQFGGITALTMAAALVTTLVAQSSCLLLWDRHHRARA